MKPKLATWRQFSRNPLVKIFFEFFLARVLLVKISFESRLGLAVQRPSRRPRPQLLPGRRHRASTRAGHARRRPTSIPQNTLKMMHELIEARKQFDVMMYPNKTHGITGADHDVHLYTMIFEYLERHL